MEKLLKLLNDEGNNKQQRPTPVDWLDDERNQLLFITLFVGLHPSLARTVGYLASKLLPFVRLKSGHALLTMTPVPNHHQPISTTIHQH